MIINLMNDDELLLDEAEDENLLDEEPIEEEPSIFNSQPPILCVDNLRQAHAADLQFLLDWRKAKKPLYFDFYRLLNMKHLYLLNKRMTKPQLLQYLLDTNDPMPEVTMEKIWDHPFNYLVIDIGQSTMNQFV